MNQLIGVSTQCLYYWVDQSRWATEQLKVVDLLRPYTSRVELHFGVNDILNFTEEMFEEYRLRLGVMKRSIHLPSLSENVVNIEDLITKIKEIVNKLLIDYCVLHADQYVLLRLKNSNIKFGFKLGLENSDIRKFGFQHLKDLGILGLPIILDIDHIEEMSHNSLGQEMSLLDNPIIGLHFSTPQNEYFKKFPEIETTHLPFARSGIEPPPTLPDGVPVVIEGVIPPNDMTLLGEEIKLIEQNYFSSNIVHHRQGGAS